MHKAVLRGVLSGPTFQLEKTCDEEDVCEDHNAVCEHGRCECQEGYRAKNEECGMCVTYLKRNNKFTPPSATFIITKRMQWSKAPVTPGLRPGYDLATTEFFSESWANRRTNARLVAEIVDDR